MKQWLVDTIKKIFQERKFYNLSEELKFKNDLNSRQSRYDLMNRFQGWF